MAKKTVAVLNKELAKAQEKANALRQELKEAKKKAFVDVGESAAKVFPDLLEAENYDSWFKAVKTLIENHRKEFDGLLLGKAPVTSSFVIGREGSELPPPQRPPVAPSNDGDM